MDIDAPAVFLPPPKIKVESEIIDLDNYKSAQDFVYEWDAKVRLKLENYYIIESEEALDSLMKWYIKSLKDEAVNLEDLKTLKAQTAKHIVFFKLYFLELNCCFVDNYFDNMEEILAIYASIEVKSVPKRQKSGSKHAYKKSLLSVCHRIISMLNLYLMKKEDRMYHVLMKMKITSLSEEGKNLLNLLYGKLLNKEPKDQSDLAFCRSYILYQRWKMVREPDDWEKMDKVVYNLYHRSSESIKNNATLKQILLPQSDSVLDTLIHISQKHVIITEEYFKYMNSIRTQEENEMFPDLNEMDISDSLLPDLDGDDEDREFNKAYISYVKTMSELSEEKSDGKLDGTMKVEPEYDEDCQIVGVSFIGNSKKSDVIYEILDDDDVEKNDAKKKQYQNVVQKKEKDDVSFSFLDSIDISESPQITTEKISCATNTSRPVHHASSAATSVSISSNLNLMEQDDSTSEPLIQNLTVDVTAPSSNKTNSGISIVNKELDNKCLNSSPKPQNSTSKVVKTIDSETQTDCNCGYCNKAMHDSSTGGKCDSYYYYGFVTPPSDITSDEHHISILDAPACANIYANIVQTGDGHDEMDNIEEEVSTANEANIELGTGESENISGTQQSTGFVPSMEGQDLYHKHSHNVRNEENTNGDYRMEFASDLKAVTPKKHGADNSLELENARCSTWCDSEFEKQANSQNLTMNGSKSEDNEQRRQDVNEATLNHDSNLVSESCSTKEVTGSMPNLLPVCSDPSIYKSNTYKPSIAQPGFNVTSPGQCPYPKKYDDISIRSPHTPCTPSNFVATHSPNNIVSLNAESRPINLPCPSPDSTDIQELNKNSFSQEEYSDEHQADYENILGNEEYVNNGSYCSEEYVTYAECNGSTEEPVNNENVSQSNLRDGEDGEDIHIEDPVLIQTEEDLSFITGDAVPVGRSVNICIDNECEESSTNSDISCPLEDGASSRSGITEQTENSLSREEESVPERANSGVKILYTSPKKIKKVSVDDFSKFEETINKLAIYNNHSPFSNLKEICDWSDVFSGPISKINGVSSSLSPDMNFDRFSPKATQKCTSQTPSSSSANSLGDVTSPPFEGIDDFRSYYEENKNNNMLGVPSPPKVVSFNSNDQFLAEKTFVNNKMNGATPDTFARHLKILQNRETRFRKPPDPTNLSITDGIHRKRTIKARNQNRSKKITITNNIIESNNSVPQSFMENPPILHGILKKKTSAFSTEDRIPIVTLERLSQDVIDHWSQKTEASRNVRLQKQASQSVPRVIRVDYDKKTSHINENDVVRYNTVNNRQWGSEYASQTNSSRRDEGFNSIELPYTEKKNGKRKRQSNKSVNLESSKKRTVFRKTEEIRLEDNGKKKTGRKRKMGKEDTI